MPFSSQTAPKPAKDNLARRDEGPPPSTQQPQAAASSTTAKNSLKRLSDQSDDSITNVPNKRTRATAAEPADNTQIPTSSRLDNPRNAKKNTHELQRLPVPPHVTHPSDGQSRNKTSHSILTPTTSYKNTKKTKASNAAATIDLSPSPPPKFHSRDKSIPTIDLSSDPPIPKPPRKPENNVNSLSGPARPKKSLSQYRYDPNAVKKASTLPAHPTEPQSTGSRSSASKDPILSETRLSRFRYDPNAVRKAPTLPTRSNKPQSTGSRSSASAGGHHDNPIDLCSSPPASPSTSTARPTTSNPPPSSSSRGPAAVPAAPAAPATPTTPASILEPAARPRAAIRSDESRAPAPVPASPPRAPSPTSSDALSTLPKKRGKKKKKKTNESSPEPVASAAKKRKKPKNAHQLEKREIYQADLEKRKRERSRSPAGDASLPSSSPSSSRPSSPNNPAPSRRRRVEDDFSNDFVPASDDDSDRPPAGPLSKRAAQHPRKDFTLSTNPRNVGRRGHHHPRSSGEARNAFMLQQTTAAMTDQKEIEENIFKEYQKLLVRAKDCEPEERLESILAWMCVLTRHRLAPVLEDLAEMVKDEPTLRALDAWASDPINFSRSNHQDALKLGNGDYTTSSDRHVFYLRSWERTVADAIVMFTKYARDFPADVALATRWLAHLTTLDPKSTIRIHYVGETVRGSPQVRQDEDVAASSSGNLHTRLGNMLPLLKEGTGPELSIWTNLTQDIGDRDGSAWTLTQRRRQHKRAESVLILLGGLFTLNSSTGGLATDSFDLDSMSPRTLEIEREIKQRFPYRPPKYIDSDSFPKLAQMRKDLTTIQQTEIEVLAADSDRRPTRAAQDSMTAALTGVGMNEHGLVVELGMYKDRTGEELRGESAISGPFAGPGPSIWREQSARARDLELRSTPVIGPKALKREFAENSWACVDIFSVTPRHDIFHLETLSLALKADKVRPIVTRLWGQGPTSLTERGGLRMPQTPEIKEVRKSCTPENFRRAAESVEPTSWFAALMADRPWANYENPGKFLCKVGDMYIYDIFDDVCSTELIYPHPAWANHDPAASALIRILSYLVELKCSVLCSIASSLQSSSKESLKKLMAQVDAECIALNDEISSVKNELAGYFGDTHSIRVLSGIRRREEQARENGTAQERYAKHSLRCSQITQHANEKAPSAPYTPWSEERANWAVELINYRDGELKCRRPDPLPHPFDDSSKFFEYLMDLKENTILIRSISGIKGNIALRTRNGTAEGRARIIAQYAQLVDTRFKERQARLIADGHDPERFSGATWIPSPTPAETIVKLARPDFKTQTPRDITHEMARCPQCGSIPLITRNTYHVCPESSEPPKRIKVTQLEDLERVRVFTPYELLLNPFFSMLSLDFLASYGLQKLPAAQFIPPEVVMPHIPAVRHAEWESAFVIIHPDDPPEAAQYQALDILACVSHLHQRAADIIHPDLFEKMGHEMLRQAFLHAEPGLRIRPLTCTECPMMLYNVSSDNPPKKKKGQMGHGPREYLPDEQTLRGGDPAFLRRVSDRLRVPHKGKRHQGVVGDEYHSFWDLPFTVKRAFIHGCFFREASLAQPIEVGEKMQTILGKAVQVVNWRSPSNR